MTSQYTLPKLLANKYKTVAEQIALRQKDLGIWNEITWGTYFKETEKMAVIFERKFALNKGDKLVIIGENRPQWLISEMAIQSLGGISVGVYQESLPEQISYYLNDTKAKVVIAENQEQVDKLLEIESEIPFVEYIVYYDPQGMQHYDNRKLQSWDELIIEAEQHLENESDFLLRNIEQVSSDDIAVIAYSAGATGDPKGVMLTHLNLITAANNLIQIDRMTEKDDYLSFLPLAWVHEQIMSVVIPLHTGSVVNFPERASTVMGDLREIGPHTLLAPPRVFQTLMSNITTRMDSASRLKRWIYRRFKKHGDQVAEGKLEGKPVSGWTKFMNVLGDWLVFSAIRDHFGLSRVKRVYLAGATLNREAFHFFHSIGINLKQTYGGTELSGIAFVHHDDDIKYESSGKPLPETQIKIADNGEVFIKNEQVFARYLHEEDQADVKDGWFTLGDCGYLSKEDHLVILDRLENVIETGNGQVVYPTLVENKLKVSPYIQEAVVYGQNKPYLTAILNIDFNNVGRWADSQSLGYTTYEDLSLRKEVLSLIDGEVNRLMEKLPEKARIYKYVVLSKPFSADDGELTRTLKVRRQYIYEQYNTLIEQMYTDTKEISIRIGNGEIREEKLLKVQQVKTKAKEVA